MKPLHKIIAVALVVVSVVVLVTVIVLNSNSTSPSNTPVTPSRSTSTTTNTTATAGPDTSAEPITGPTTKPETTATAHHPNGTIHSAPGASLAILVSPTTQPATSGEQSVGDLAWSNWLKEHNRDYLNDADETKRRKAIFLDNHDYIQKFNKEHSFVLRLNQFADLTTDEINQQYIGNLLDKHATFINQYRVPPPVDKGVIKLNGQFDPEHINWVEKGVVNRVYDQGKCHSGQIYTLVAAMESSIKIKNGEPKQLSTQQLLDCLKTKEMESKKKSVCEVGAAMMDAVAYLQQDGVHLATDYPSYDLLHHECTVDKLAKDAEIIKMGPYNIVHPADITEALQYGPLPVVINASLRSFHFYSDGIYDDTSCSKDLYNHHALLVGYDPERQSWILQNSFGEKWGQSGQIRIKRSGDNLCGLEDGVIHL